MPTPDQMKFRRNLEQESSSQYVQQTGYLENFQMAMGRFIDEDMSISRYINLYAPQMGGFDGGAAWQRNEELRKAMVAGILPEDKIDQFKVHGMRGLNSKFRGGWNWSKMAQWAKESGLMPDIETDEEVFDRMRDGLKERREMAEDVFSRSSGMGTFGQIMGTLNAAAVDPLAIPTYFIGVGALAKSVSALKVGVSIAATEAAFEAGIQHEVYRWKEDIGVEYGVMDALKTIGLVAGTAGTLAGASQLLTNIFAGSKITKTGSMIQKIKDLDLMDPKRVDEMFEAKLGMSKMPEKLPGNMDAKFEAPELNKAVNIVLNRASEYDKISRVYPKLNVEEYEGKMVERNREMLSEPVYPTADVDAGAGKQVDAYRQEYSDAVDKQLQARAADEAKPVDIELDDGTVINGEKHIQQAREGADDLASALEACKV